MIVVDSSVWMDLFRGRQTPQTIALISFARKDHLLVGDLVICEVLQGARDEKEALAMETTLRKFNVASMLDPELAAVAANNYRLLRAQGITLRKIVDLIIGTFCIVRRHVLLHANRDFEPMEKYLGLRTVPANWAVHDEPREVAFA